MQASVRLAQGPEGACRGDNRERWRLFARIMAGAQPAMDTSPQMREGPS